MNIRQLKSTHPGLVRGFSLVEMMISVTIGLMIVAALIGVLTSNARNTKTNDRSAELQGNGRFALDNMKRAVRNAGYRGYTWADPATPTTGIPSTSNECLETGAGNGAFVTNIRQGIWGANDSNPYSNNCLASGYLRGDLLAIRHANLIPRIGNTTNGTLYFRSSYSVGEIFNGNGTSATSTATPTTSPITIAGTPQADFQLQEFVYYIGSDTDNPSIPALRRIALKGNGETCNETTLTVTTMCDEMLVSGIEQMQVQYARLDTASNTQYFNADGIAGTSTDTPSTITSYAWDEVNSVRIWLLARTARAENGYSNTTSYVMGDQTYTVNDSFRRQLFSTVVQLRN